MGTEPPRLEKLIKDLRKATETWEISKHRFQYGTSRWSNGNGDVEIGLDSLDMLDDVMEVIEQSFRLQDVE